jgi:hypothetical protein
MPVDTDAPAGGNRSPGVVQAARKAKGEVGGAYATPIKEVEVVNLNSSEAVVQARKAKEEEDAPIKASKEVVNLKFVLDKKRLRLSESKVHKSASQLQRRPLD